MTIRIDNIQREDIIDADINELIEWKGPEASLLLGGPDSRISGYAAACEETAEGWIAREGTGSWWLQRAAETAARPRGWDGVSFRGIDVPQYSPDAVDTPICNDPDAISAVARPRPRKCAKADLIQPLPASQRASGRARKLASKNPPWFRRSASFSKTRSKNLCPFSPPLGVTSRSHASFVELSRFSFGTSRRY